MNWNSDTLTASRDQLALRPMTAAELRGFTYACDSLVTWMNQLNDGSNPVYTTREISAFAHALQRGAAAAHSKSTRGRPGGT